LPFAVVPFAVAHADIGTMLPGEKVFPSALTWIFTALATTKTAVFLDSVASAKNDDVMERNFLEGGCLDNGNDGGGAVNASVIN
jgi:hypothetical protein